MTTKPFIVQRSRSQVARMEDFSTADPLPVESRGPEFWRPAVPLYPSRSRRRSRVRLDPEVLDFFSTQKEDDRAGINAVLRAYVERRRADGQSKA